MQNCTNELKLAILTLALSTCLYETSSGQTNLDSSRAETALTVFDQVTTPFVYASRSYLKEHDHWPASIEELTQYALEKDDSLLTRRFDSISLSLQDEHDLFISCRMKPFKVKLLPVESASTVLSLNGRVSILPPNGGSFVSVIGVYVDSMSVVLPDSTQKVATGLSSVLAKIIRPRY